MQSALQNSRIVPDIFDAVDFDNEVEMSVEFPTGFKVANGNDIPKDKATHTAAVPTELCHIAASCRAVHCHCTNTTPLNGAVRRTLVTTRPAILCIVTAQAQDPPKVEVVGAKGLYTLIGSNADAPSPDVGNRFCFTQDTRDWGLG